MDHRRRRLQLPVWEEDKERYMVEYAKFKSRSRKKETHATFLHALLEQWAKRAQTTQKDFQ